MAIIRCPECGHQISDKAPFCPSCGVAIAGRVLTCHKCGNVYFSNLAECPSCHEPNAGGNTTTPTGNGNCGCTTAARNVASAGQGAEIVVGTTNAGNNGNGGSVHDENASDAPKTSGKRNNKLILIVTLVVVVVISAICWWMNRVSSQSKEKVAYEYAMTSNDPQVLQSYLDKYGDAPEEHRDSIEAHLGMLKQIDQDWTNALVSGSKSALEQYLSMHPNSPFKNIAMHKIDSIDWSSANAANTVEAMENYLEVHPDGDYVDEANSMIKGLNAKTLQPEEKLMVSSVFSTFFQSLNGRDADALTSTVSPLMTSFLGKSDATRGDVITFMNKIYKSDVASMSWQSAGNYAISKKEIGDEQYEYTVSFSATQEVAHTDNSTSVSKYRIAAKVNPDGRITEFNMTKILE